MKRTRADIERLMAELKLAEAGLGDPVAMNGKAVERIRLGSRDSLDYAALGYTIHNIYGVIENACLRISKFFESGLPSEAWHRELLDRMVLDIPGTRPAFFTRDQSFLIDDLRAFRHVFRNLYGRPLDAGKILALQEKVAPAIEVFRASVLRYTEFLRRLAESVEE
jgi:hypothetical protein